MVSHVLRPIHVFKTRIARRFRANQSGSVMFEHSLLAGLLGLAILAAGNSIYLSLS